MPVVPASGRAPEEEQWRDGLISMQNQAIGVPSRAGSSELLQQQLLHLVLGTYIRRYLNRLVFQPRQLLPVLVLVLVQVLVQVLVLVLIP